MCQCSLGKCDKEQHSEMHIKLGHKFYSNIQCVPGKRKPINQVNFSENLMIYQKKFTLLQNSVYPLSFDTSYKMYGQA